MIDHEQTETKALPDSCVNIYLYFIMIVHKQQKFASMAQQIPSLVVVVGALCQHIIKT